VIVDFIQAIAAKYGGEFAPESSVWTQSASSIVDMELTIPSKWVGYLLEVIGYSSGSDVKVTFIDHNDIPRWEWTELLDTEAHTDVIPFLEKFYSGTIKFRFTNTSGANRTVGWYVVILLIPEENRIAFEKAVKELADLVPTLKKIAEKIQVGLVPIGGFAHG